MKEVCAVVALTETVRSCEDKYNELRAFCMYDKVIAFDENDGFIRVEY